MPVPLITGAIRTVENLPVPDSVLRFGVQSLIRTRERSLKPDPQVDRAFADDMRRRAIALHTDAANEQHYEVPQEFFGLTLGPHRKYSCCYYATGNETLEEAEEAALTITADRAGLADGQRILELGCGWGSLTLFMAARYPNASITAVSNSASQRRYIEQTAQVRGLSNVRVITCDMNAFLPEGTFDRVVSVEMFEHMSNWDALLSKVRGALEPNGRLFIHVFSHRATPYRFDHTDPSDWIGRYFFTGGIMPSDGLIRQFCDLVEVEEEWRWSGTHYARTATQWIENLDRNQTEIDPILQRVYGSKAALWKRRWRLFFLATEGLFGHANGEEWGVKHYRLRPVR
ncbi:MAG: cyclopropane-fatty-acyl-phospholipid synthase family protein [Hyphomicrobium sp.]|nr:cyclopropane-fatty-acyl-phospholipid synthase family protein [Hyphomicrobium sp.]